MNKFGQLLNYLKGLGSSGSQFGLPSDPSTFTFSPDQIKKAPGAGFYNSNMGIGEDKNLKKGISVTIIATGFNSEQQHEIVNTEAKKIIHTLEEDQSFVQDLTDHDKESKNKIKYNLDKEYKINKLDDN